VPQPLSAGILLFRQRPGATEVLLIRPGGPFWRNRDVGAWMIPKGAVEPGETSVEAALREFEEEVGIRLTQVPFPLCKVRQAGGKWVEAFAVEGDCDAAAISSISFSMEWPRGSGQMQEFPEAEEARWMSLAEARRMMLESQLPILDALEERLSRDAR
jgi:predicted NUDIX family NTP pyrophosphohydrolase